MERKNGLRLYLAIVTGISIISCSEQERPYLTANQVISDKITVLYQTKTKEQLAAITYEEAYNMFTKEERQVLGSGHWMFDANIPVVVSVIRSVKQTIAPFWLEQNGFKKTDLLVSNEISEFEIWQKRYDSGHVGLGINGFTNQGLHYFVCVGPQNKDDELMLSNFYPENQYVGVMDNGAFTYHDWDELVLFDVPESLKGQKLLTTVRGRATEAHLAGGFRSTKFPSSEQPDQIMLTWSNDPSTTIDIQWRTNNTVESGAVNYRVIGSSDALTAEAEKYEMEDLMLMNDRFIHRFTAHLTGLKPGTTYEYRIEGQEGWDEKQTFTTQSNNDSFSFIWYGDTHYSPIWGEMANTAFKNHPSAVFHSIAGDMVSDGTYRDQWDEIFEYSKDIICRRPFMNVMGNHDNRAGLGALMYRELFSYPLNGPEDVEREHTYSFAYKNALFLMIDATSPVDKQTKWIEQQLAGSDATWKFAMFHFPPYNWEEPYYDIQQTWVPVFDKYHVDMVMSGHIHYYMRSKPMKAGKVTESCSDGTIYAISIGIPSHTPEMTEEPYAEVINAEGQFYQYINIDGNELSYISVDSEDNIIDTFQLKK